MTPDRRAMIAKIHVAKKDLALTDDTYRAVVARMTGHDSSAACTDAQLHRLLAEFERLGWSATKGARNTDKKPWVRKIHAIWAELQPLLDNADATTLAGFVRRQTKTLKTPNGIDKPEWLDAKSATKVIQGLQAWLAREQAKQSHPESHHA